MCGTGLLLLAAVAGVHGQIYNLEGQPVPTNRSIQFLYAFYIYSSADAPARQAGVPFVSYEHLTAKVTSGRVAPQGYESLQLSIIKYQDFWEFIDPEKFCSSKDDVAAGRASKMGNLLLKPRDPDDKRQPRADLEVYSQTVYFDPPEADQVTRFEVKVTGVYILVYSNCGPFYDATTVGRVVVKNAYGFLPGHEYHKLPFYGYLSVVYVILAVTWSCFSLRWWKELFGLQNCIFGVICLGLAESLVCYWSLRVWNHTGERSTLLFVICILFTVLKTTFSYMLVLVASLGWGVTKPFLEQQAVVKIKALAWVFIALDFVRETVLSFRHSQTFGVSFVILCLLPVSLLNGGIFYWVFMALSQLMESLEERGQREKLVLFQRLWTILVSSLAIATLTIMYHLFTLTFDITKRWKGEWLFSDGISHIIFAGVLCAIMFLLAPHKSSQRYAYSQAPGAEDSGAIWADEDLDEEGEDLDFWSATMAAQTNDWPDEPRPELVGAAEDDKADDKSDI